MFYLIVSLWLDFRPDCDITLKVHIICFISLSSYKSDKLKYSHLILSLYKCDITVLKHFFIKTLDTLRVTFYT